MKVFITGGGGTLGTELIRQLEGQATEIVAYTSQKLDVCDRKEVAKAIKSQSPDVIFHCAAKTDVDWCETHPNESYRVNVESVGYVIDAAEQVGASLIFPSTYYVYAELSHDPIDDRLHDPDLSRLTMVYTRHKLQAEQLIEKTSYQKVFIVRLGSLFGGGVNDKKFVGKIVH